MQMTALPMTTKHDNYAYLLPAKRRPSLVSTIMKKLASVRAAIFITASIKTVVTEDSKFWSCIITSFNVCADDIFYSFENRPD